MLYLVTSKTFGRVFQIKSTESFNDAITCCHYYILQLLSFDNSN